MNVVVETTPRGKDRMLADGMLADGITKRKSRTKLGYGADAYYWREDMIGFRLARALVDLVAERQKVARQKFEEAAEPWDT